MIATCPRVEWMPPRRWIVEIDPSVPSLGDELRQLRDKKKWSQSYVARQFGHSDNTKISRWETDKQAPTASELRQLADLYGVSSDDLAVIAHQAELQRDRLKEIEGPSVAIPAEPEIVDALRVLIRFEPEDIPGVTEWMLQKAEGFPPRAKKEAAS